MGWLSIRNVPDRFVGQKVWDNCHIPRESKLLVLAAAEGALGDKQVDLRELAINEPQVPPQLRGPTVAQAAAEALARIAQFTVMAP